MGEIISFRLHGQTTQPSGDTIFIDPVEDGGGCWGIFRAGVTGENRVTTRFSFTDAEAEARRIARETGATYDDGSGDAA